MCNYPTCEKELYALVQSLKKWKHYLMGKETIIHTDHQTLQYLQSQKNIQQSRHYRWMVFFQQFHLVIRYKRGTSNKVADMLSRPLVSASIVLKNDSLDHDSYIEQYANDEYFKDVYERRTCGSHVENFYVQDKLLYHMEKLCIPTNERVHIIRETHTSLISSHFWVGKFLSHL